MSQSPRSKAKKDGGEAVLITPAFLRRHSLPLPSEGGDKNERGRILVVGGAPSLPGAVILAATAALRAGAGRLRIATVQSVATHVGVAVPECLVLGLPETSSGALDPKTADELVAQANQAPAVVFGPGLADSKAVTALLTSVLPRLDGPTVVLDAAALAFVSEDRAALRGLNGRAILTPHAGEMAKVLGMDKEEITADPATVARRAAADLGVVVALKGRETYIAAPDGALYVNRAGNVGLATSGSGDTLAGIIGGLAARGAEPWLAAVWGVYLHAVAGDALARRVGPLGYLARELPAEVPGLMADLAKSPKTQK